jgi:hypothetical protein
MLAGLSARDRRALIVGLGVLGFGLAAGRGFPAWRRWDRENRESLVELRTELAQAREETRLAPLFADSAAARTRRLVQRAPEILEGETPSAAAATLAALVSGAAAQAHADLGAVELHADSLGAPTFIPVSVKATATGDLPGLLRMVNALEEGPEALRIVEWSLTQADPGGAADRAESLRLELVVAGLALPPKERP